MLSYRNTFPLSSLDGQSISSQEIKAVFDKAPFLAKFVSTCIEHVQSNNLLVACRTLCRELIDLALAPYNDIEDRPRVTNASENDLRFFPNWPNVRK